MPKEKLIKRVTTVETFEAADEDRGVEDDEEEQDEVEEDEGDEDEPSPRKRRR